MAEQKIQDELDFSKQGWHELIDMHEEVVAHMQLSVSVFVSGSLDMAKELIQKKKQFGKQERLGAQQHLQRLRGGHIESIETSSIHLDILRDLKELFPISHLWLILWCMAIPPGSWTVVMPMRSWMLRNRRLPV
ncbi:MAG: hypothetical protein ACNYPI_05870 [Arenicellales bacterium WSBS_2016_MAG_OTU3]